MEIFSSSASSAQPNGIRVGKSMAVRLLAFACLRSSLFVKGQDLVYGDRWNYDSTVARGDGFVDYGPAQWGDIECDERDREGLDACIAYKDKWHTGRGWEVEKNYCRWCPVDAPGSCGRHHMSPINLERNRGLGFWELTTELNDGKPGLDAHPSAKECIDVHWMKYEDAWCPIDQLQDANAFTIERHALRISQPITIINDDEARLDCFVEGKGRKFGRIDFSKGFSQWWFLSHIDIHTPSEHTQEGKKYDAELQLHHFYSVTEAVAGVANELGTVTMFLQAYDDAPPYRELDRVICEWRRYEAETRSQCGLSQLENSYPGCFPYIMQGEKRRNMRTSEKKSQSREKTYQNVYDLLLAHENHSQMGLNTSLPSLKMDPENWEPSEKRDEEWTEFIAEQSARFKADDQLWKDLHQEFRNNTERAHEEYHERHRRKLLGGNEIEWFNYWPMLGVRTEYYFRYSGSQTTPPCYGNVNNEGTRKGINHWRVMKDPIRIHPRQLKEMKRLVAQRIAPANDPVNACQADTAAKVADGGEIVDNARPLQYFHPAHSKVFCECKDWPSKWPEDRDWCEIENVYERYYKTPYNYRTDGF